jgi:hypothetical protein
MTVVITSAGVAFVRGVLAGGMSVGADDWAVIGPTLLWPLWGLALGAATVAYADRRRGACRACEGGEVPRR